MLEQLITREDLERCIDDRIPPNHIGWRIGNVIYLFRIDYLADGPHLIRTGQTLPADRQDFPYPRLSSEWAPPADACASVMPSISTGIYPKGTFSEKEARRELEQHLKERFKKLVFRDYWHGLQRQTQQLIQELQETPE
jgi:hypothetical protein